MKDICQFQCNVKNRKNESVCSYALHAGASTNYILISILYIYLISLHCKLKVINNFKYIKMNILKYNIDQYHVYFGSGYHGLF